MSSRARSSKPRTADGGMFGQMVLDSGYILAGAGALFVQSRTRDFSDVRERERLQTATIEITLRRAATRHTWLAGIAADWYALRSGDALPTTYVSTRPGIFFHDDMTVAPWLLLSGSLRLDYHNLYEVLAEPARIRSRAPRAVGGAILGRSGILHAEAAHRGDGSGGPVAPDD